MVAQRVNYLCSKPDCRANTIGPQAHPRKVLNIGVAGHINAASPGGPRYNPSLTAEERRDPHNAIWLCQSCGKLVDNDENKFTEEELRHWKAEAEKEALNLIGKTIVSKSLSSRAFLEVYACSQGGEPSSCKAQ